MNQSENNNTQSQTDPSEIAPSLGNKDEHPSKRTIGAVLREEREKKGLSYDNICEITKLRPRFLKALENEAWNDLPSPVFARGFLRSYGRALGLEEDEIMDLFQEPDLIKVSEFKPLGKTVRSNKAFSIVMIFLLLALVPAYFLWKGYTLSEKDLNTLRVRIPEGQQPEKPKKMAGFTQDIVASDPIATPPIQVDSGTETDRDSIDAEPAADTTEKKEVLSGESLLLAPVQEIAAPEITLRAQIKETTWLKISIDNQAPKEYIFQPNEYHEWNAEKGFDLLIGNAGGLDLELNGKAVKHFGTPGQVVRLRLPKSFKRTLQN